MSTTNLKIQNGITLIPVAADPATAENGDIIYRSDLNKFRKYENGAWSDLSGGGGGTDFSDADFRIQDNSDATKEIAFQASGIATGTTRTITMPDTDINLGDIASAVAAANGAQADVDDVITLSGVPANSEDLGAFTGGVISDNLTVKAALQELETYVETPALAYDNMTKIMSDKDTGIYKVVTWKDISDVRRKESTLSGGTAPEFTTRTVVFYDTDGTTVLDTIVFTLNYDVDGDLVSEEL